MNSYVPLVLGTAGHIDHGKTALTRALTGVDTDRLPEEKARGITIDLGFASLRLGRYELAVVDVPGHERFVRNMLAGAGGFDVALLVVAADDGIMPQTREHFEILKLLGIPQGVIALTKRDLVEPEWLDLVRADLRTLIAGSFLEGCEIVPTSTVSGEGLAELKEALERACHRVAERPRPDPGRFRLAIDRVFTREGLGVIVTGTVVSGAVTVGEDLECWPLGRLVKVRGLQRHGRGVERVERGARAAIHLGGIKQTDLARGHELATPGYLNASRRLTVELRVACDAPRPLRHRGRYRLHLGSGEVNAGLILLRNEEGRPVSQLDAGQTGLGQLVVARPVTAVFDQPFILRETTPPTTLGGGRVLQPEAGPIRRRDAVLIERAQRLAQAHDPVERLERAVALIPPDPDRLTPSSLCRTTGLTPEVAAAAWAELKRTGMILDLAIGPRRALSVTREVVEEWERRVEAALTRLHAARPRQSTIPRGHLAAELADLAQRGGEPLIATLLERLRDRGRILIEGDPPARVARIDHQPRLSQSERKLKSELLQAITSAGLEPPDLKSLTTRLGIKKPSLAVELLTLLVEEERIVEVAPGLWYDAQIEAEIRRRVTARLKQVETMSMAELRDLLGTTRRYALPLGEYLDRVGVTLRDGDHRRLGPAARLDEPID